MDLLMSRYGDIAYIMNTDMDFGIGLINEAFKQRERGEMFTLYASMFPHMTKETFISFDQFYRGPDPTLNKASGYETDTKKVMRKVENIMEDFEYTK